MICEIKDQIPNNWGLILQCLSVFTHKTNNHQNNIYDYNQNPFDNFVFKNQRPECQSQIIWFSTFIIDHIIQLQ